jgi:hypothetical protein
MAYSQTDFLTSLAYLMGERSVNSTTSTPRADYLQNALNEAYSAYPWRFARTNATLTISSGIATLPTNYDDNQIAHAKFNDGNDEKLDLIDPDDAESYSNGDRQAWIESIDDSRYKLVTKDSDLTTALFRYQKKAPTLDSAGTVTTAYPNKRTIALGARRDVKLGQNPDADISQEEKIFSKALSKDIAAHQVSAPRKKRRTAAGRTGDF